jgi:hypothetical protein
MHLDSCPQEGFEFDVKDVERLSRDFVEAQKERNEFFDAQMAVSG